MKKPVFMIYVGPNDKMRGLYTYMRFPAGYPQHIAEALEENPALGALFMPWSRFLKLPPPGHVPRARTKPPAPPPGARKLGPPIAGERGFRSVRLAK